MTIVLSKQDKKRQTHSEPAEARRRLSFGHGHFTGRQVQVHKVRSGGQNVTALKIGAESPGK